MAPQRSTELQYLSDVCITAALDYQFPPFLRRESRLEGLRSHTVAVVGDLAAPELAAAAPTGDSDVDDAG